uniref:ATP synthase F0 subunit 6 n=1 Tax=Phyllodoce medipapillata TaxID=868040 RepID=UPI0030FF3199
MMVDIFSSFDPYINMSFQSFSFMFWCFVGFSMMLISSSFWLSFNQVSWIMSYPLDIMNMQSSRTFSHHLKGFTSVVVSLFVMLILINLLGLLPYSFSYSSHMVFSLIFGLPLWFSLLLSSFLNSPSTFMGGLLPGGAPDWLNPFLVLIETVSILVRPITLSVRLVANMSAGHIVLSLIGIYASSFIFLSSFSFIMLLFIQIFYIIFEVGICMIQGYIFCLLLTLYADDHTVN